MTHVFYAKRQLRGSTDFQEVTNAGSRNYKATLNSLSIIVQQDATIYSFIIFSADSSTCFG